jgi:ATP-dependent helicase/nuclease subunit A
VLTDRVARLLFAGTPPQRILCLTYTKAAASEMQNRLFKRLGEWAMMPDPELIAELSVLDPDADVTPEAVGHARTLFARAVETPGGLKIQTIHSFCGALLRRFPLEAGVAPQFTELDERRTNEILQAAMDDIALGPQRDVLDGISAYVSDLDASDLARSIVYKREQFTAGVTASDIWGWFDLPQGFDDAALLGDAFLGDEDLAFRNAADVMDVSPNKTDHKSSEILKSWIGAERNISLLSQCCSKLLVGSGVSAGLSRFGRASAGFPTKKCATQNPDVLRNLSEFMQRIEASSERLFALKAARKTWALHKFAQEILPVYTAEKGRLGLLDFDDLVQKTRDLLSISSVAQWVLFRLDGGIDHILVDEAQDTSPDQWTVIRLLAEEFTSGVGAREDTTRTIFVVGDQKQSIYSFQGAAPGAFDEMKEHFRGRLDEIELSLQDISLEHSFRSSPAILKLTDETFGLTNGHGVGGETNHIAFFDDIPGRVDLWPLIEPEAIEPAPKDWENPVDLQTPEHHTNRLADLVAQNVKDLIERGSLPRKKSAKTSVEPGDILILVRNRSGLFYPMLRALKKLSLPVAGADQLVLNDELAVKDIISLLAFLSMPDDDLALAETLKSPLFGWSEQDLFSLAHGRTAVTLWRELFTRRAEWPKTFDVLNDLRKEADFLRPYDLVQRVLIRHEGRKKFLARLGDEAQDGLDALLHQALAYEAGEAPSLTGFIGWLGAESMKLKRVLDETSNLVRVMTVHGSKGLEAPIVILPDTLRETGAPKDEVIDLGASCLAWKSAKGDNAKALNAAVEALRSKNDEEERRLLYVAMTRAENWLIVAGAGKQKKDGVNWYTLIENGMRSIEAEECSFTNGIGLRYAHGDWPQLVIQSSCASDNKESLPNWITQLTPSSVVSNEFLSPSDLGGGKALSGDVVGLGSEAALRKGRQLHVLLEHLPSHPVEEWDDLAALFLSEGEDAALSGEVEALLEEAKRTIWGTYDWGVFSKRAMAEVPFSGKLKSLHNRRIHGVIDRLIFEEDCVRIVDFKSNTVVPSSVELVPEGVLRQMAAYLEVCEAIYPKLHVEVAVLWTQTASLMTLPHDLVRSALERTELP